MRSSLLSILAVASCSAISVVLATFDIPSSSIRITSGLGLFKSKKDRCLETQLNGIPLPVLNDEDKAVYRTAKGDAERHAFLSLVAQGHQEHADKMLRLWGDGAAPEHARKKLENGDLLLAHMEKAQQLGYGRSGERHIGDAGGGAPSLLKRPFKKKPATEPSPPGPPPRPSSSEPTFSVKPGSKLNGLRIPNMRREEEHKYLSLSDDGARHDFLAGVAFQDSVEHAKLGRAASDEAWGLRMATSYLRKSEAGKKLAMAHRDQARRLQTTQG